MVLRFFHLHFELQTPSSSVELRAAVSWERRFVLLGLISIQYCQATGVRTHVYIIFLTNSGITKSM